MLHQVEMPMHKSISASKLCSSAVQGHRYDIKLWQYFQASTSGIAVDSIMGVQTFKNAGNKEGNKHNNNAKLIN